MLSTLLSLEGKIQDKTRKALLLQFKAVLEEVFICQALRFEVKPIGCSASSVTSVGTSEPGQLHTVTGR